MNIVDIDRNTEGTFFRCLHDEKPGNPQAIALRRRWYDSHKEKGLRAKVLIGEGGEVVGMCQYIPIEHSHLIGKHLMAILCIWVHGYDHLVGNQQHKGYGKYILQHIEKDARDSGAKGIAAWGMSFPFWNPVSFYEHMGYSPVDTEGPVVLTWKPFVEGAEPPALIHPKRLPEKVEEKPRVSVFVSGWCGVGCYWCAGVREAVAGIEDRVIYEEYDTSNRETLLSWGIDDGVLVDGEFRRGPWSSDDLRRDLLRLSAERNKASEQDA